MLATTCADLSATTGLTLVTGHRDFSSPVGRGIEAAVTLFNEGFTEAAMFELLRLRFLAKHLSDVAARDAKLARGFRRQLKRDGGSDAFYGLRFEINIAASLSRNGIRFLKSESPDFRVGPAFIECSSCRIDGYPEKESYHYKLASVIRRKQEMKYAIPSTALFVDMTNIWSRTGSVSKGEWKRVVEESVASGKYGSVVMFAYLLDFSSRGIKSIYSRQDLGWIDCSLASLLDGLFPVGHHEIDNGRIPSEG